MESERLKEYVELKAEIARKGMAGILGLYRTYRSNYLSFSKQYASNKDIRVQSYNDAIIKLYNAIVQNKFDPDKASLKTFLFNIGKNNLINKLNKEHTYNKFFKEEQTIERFSEAMREFDTNKYSSEAWSQKLEEAYKQLGSKCKEIILYFYYDALDSEEIMKIMSYDSIQVVYSAKSRCLKSLRKLISETNG